MVDEVRAPKNRRRTRRVRTPTLLQMEALECGAACLGIVLGYHGRVVPLDELRRECGVSRDGSKASNVLKAAAKYGLVASGYRQEPEDLPDLPLPAVVFWNMNHFVVVEGFGRGKVFLNDPATGPRTVPDDEFDQSYTGIVLTFEKGPEFRKGGRKPTLVSLLRARLGGSGPALGYAVLTGLLLVVPSLAVPAFSLVFVDEILVRKMLDWVKPLLLAMGIAALLRGGLSYLQQSSLSRLDTKLALTLSSRFFWHVLRLPIEFFSQRYGVEIGTRVVLNDRVAKVLSRQVATAVLNVMVIAFYAAVMFQYDVWLTGVSIGIALLNIAAMQTVRRARTDRNQRLLQERGKLMGMAMGGLQMIETLKATGSESSFFERWSGGLAKVVDAEQGLGVSTRMLLAIPPLLMALNIAAILSFGGLQVMNGALSMGMLVAFMSLMWRFITPVNDLVSVGSVLQEAEGDLNRLDDVLASDLDRHAAEDSADPRADGGARTKKLSGRVELRNVTFGYSPLDPPLVEGLNLTLEPGARVALVGGSGSGKSTVSRLVAGLYEPWSGEILFDGEPRSRLARSVVTNSLALVDQDIFLFEGTVAENLAMWDSTVPEAGLIQAAKDACIHEDISIRPGGYASPVEEGGRNFSGGQRQRLELSRALAGNPTILVLDEATSALDARTEQIVDDSLRRRGCTCLIVAHRLSTIRDCDEIIVLDRGKVVERGTHEGMRATDGPYRRLIEMG